MAVYVRDMIRGKSKPNLVTWGLWAFAPLVATGAALSADANLWATVRIFTAGFGPLVVFISAFLVRQGYWKLSKFDYACGALSLLALGVWLGAENPILAILLAAIADLLATLPTLIKAWKFPETETAYTYLVGIFTACLAIPSIPVWNVENSAFQIYLLIANTSLFAVVLRGYLKRRVNNIEKAVQFATQKFEAAGRRNHFLEVYDILRNQFHTKDENILIAGLLHDTLEDTDTSFEEIEREFSKEIATLVDEVSHPKDYSGAQVQEYYEKLKHISTSAKIVKLADFLSHLKRLIGIYQRGEEATNPIFVENGRYARDIIAVAETCPESEAKTIVMKLAKELSVLHQRSPVWGV